MNKKITGITVYYYKVCHRKLWYFCNQIQMEGSSEDVAIGKILDEQTYKRDNKHINIDNVINIDFIRSKGILHEVKKSNKIEDASIIQIKYYLYYLNKRGVSNIIGKLDYPLLKKTVEVKLTQEDIDEIEDIIKNINIIINKDQPPKLEKKRICKACAYYELCFI